MTTIEEQKAKVKECRESGISAKAWCRAEGIAYTTYMRWSRKFPREIKKEPEKKQRWFSIEDKTLKSGEESKQKNKSKIVLTNGNWHIEIDEEISTELITKTLQVVNSICS